MSTDEEQLLEAYNVLGLFHSESEFGELACVGAGIGGGFVDTKELHVMTYKEAVTGPEQPYWLKAIEEERDRMMEHAVWKPIDKKQIPRGAKIIDCTWAMKKKSNGTYRARVNARGFKQVAGKHYDSATISAPVTNDATIRICLTIMLMMGGTGK
jgi:Reverse transcriptase (RNA-dependent DNA polymerase).